MKDGLKKGITCETSMGKITPNSLRYYKRNKILNMLDRKRGAATVIDLRVAMLSMDKTISIHSHWFPHLLDAETNPQGRLHFRCIDDEELNKWVSVLRIYLMWIRRYLHVINRNLKQSFWDEQVKVKFTVEY